MTKRLTIAAACSLAEASGLVAYAQRGFYSHFLRVRTKDYRTLGTPDIINGTVKRRSILKLIEKEKCP